MPVIFTRKPFTWAVLHALLQNIASACTLVRKRENGTLEVVFPLETCEIADGKMLFRFFNWDTIGGRRPHDKDSPYLFVRRFVLGRGQGNAPNQT